MIIVVGGIKGGSGKTTIATNFTVMRSAEATNRKVLLVDADEQKSASDWVSMRAENKYVQSNWTTVQLSGTLVHQQLKNLMNEYDDIIVDVGGRDTTSQRAALVHADVYVIPFKPRSFDIWTLGPQVSLITQVQSINPNLKCIAIINQADSCGSDHYEAIDIINEHVELNCPRIWIRNRKAFANAATQGLAVHEIKNKDYKAINEMGLAYQCVYS